MRKYAVALVVVLLSGLLASCGGSETSLPCKTVEQSTLNEMTISSLMDEEGLFGIISPVPRYSMSVEVDTSSVFDDWQIAIHQVGGDEELYGINLDIRYFIKNVEYVPPLETRRDRLGALAGGPKTRTSPQHIDYPSTYFDDPVLTNLIHDSNRDLLAVTSCEVTGARIWDLDDERTLKVLYPAKENPPTTTAAPTTTVPSPTTSTTATTTRAPTTTKPALTTGERNARESAAGYLKYSAFSRSGLIDQLEYEGFTTTQAQYGVNAVGY